MEEGSYFSPLYSLEGEVKCFVPRQSGKEEGDPTLSRAGQARPHAHGPQPATATGQRHKSHTRAPWREWHVLPSYDMRSTNTHNRQRQKLTWGSHGTQQPQAPSNQAASGKLPSDDSACRTQFFSVYMLGTCYLDRSHSVSRYVPFKRVEFHIG